jgi:predicted nucleic acid-binding protein
MAQEQNANLLLTDDTAARLAAKTLGITAHGTVGVIVRASRRGRRTPAQVIALLRSIPEVSTLHLRRSLLQSVIAEVERLS